MGRMLVVDLPDGPRILEQTQADNEHQLQERLKAHPELLPLDELGLVGPLAVVGRESHVRSGSVDLVLLGNGGDLVLVEFKTGPQNPDFRAALAQLLDYGSDIWGMSLETFEASVVRPPRPLTEVVAGWEPPGDAAVAWPDRLAAQLRDGTFHYVVVAQRFTEPMLRTLRYLNATTNGARFSAVELVRFRDAGGIEAFEARYAGGADPVTRSGTKDALAGLPALLDLVGDDDYRDGLQHFFDGLAAMPGLTVFWGTTGCSLRVAIRGHAPLSVGWVFPPGTPRWMGLTDVTLGWYEDANGLALPDEARTALEAYGSALADVGGVPAKSTAIHGRTFTQAALVPNVGPLVAAVRDVVDALTQA